MWHNIAKKDLALLLPFMYINFECNKLKFYSGSDIYSIRIFAKLSGARLSVPSIAIM